MDRDTTERLMFMFVFSLLWLKQMVTERLMEILSDPFQIWSMDFSSNVSELLLKR